MITKRMVIFASPGSFIAPEPERCVIVEVQARGPSAVVLRLLAWTFAVLRHQIQYGDQSPAKSF